MGSTVYTEREANAFRTEDGRIGYVLFEKTYEKNVHPHSPSWGACAFGNLEDALAAIFLHAASVESGMLQSRGRTPSASSYIASWLELLASPKEFVAEGKTTLQFGKYGTTLPTSSYNDEDHKAIILQSLREAGFSDQAAILEQENGKIEANFAKDFDLLRTIYGHTSKRRVHPSYLVRHPWHGLPNSDLGYRPKAVKTKSNWTPPTVYRAPEHANQQREHSNLLVGTPNGELVSAGWAYSLIGDYLKGAWRDELAQPGSYKTNLSKLRKTIEEATEVPVGTRIHFSIDFLPADASPSTKRWQLRELEQIAEALGKGRCGEFMTTWGEVVAAPTQRYAATHSSSARWVLPQSQTNHMSIQDLFEQAFA